jgi:hypothetical protein
MKWISRRGVWFTIALAVCWYLASWTELENNAWALVGMILFLCFFYGALWPEKVVPLDRRRERRVDEVIPESSLCWIPEAVIDQPVRKSITSQSGSDTPSEGG